MLTRRNDNNLPMGRVRRGRAVVVGLGLDEADGHVRYTKGEGFELCGGSDEAHREMQRRAKRIRDEMTRLGIPSERMTYDQYLTLREIVERVNCE